MRRFAYIFLIPLFVIGGNVNAQFAKPLPKKQNPWKEAQFSVGIIGGLSATRWFHQGGTSTNFEQLITTIALDSTFLSSALNNALAGITVQKKLGEYNAIGLEVIYANRSTKLNNRFVTPISINHSIEVLAHSSIQYSELFIQIPITQYFTNSAKTIRPYVFVAPRVSLPLQGVFSQEKDTLINASPLFSQYNNATRLINQTTTTSTTDTISARNMNRWNIGAVVGLGIQFRIPVGSYYFDTKLDASCHLGLLNTYSKYERGLVVKKDSNGNDILDPNGNPVLDLPINLNTGRPIDPALLGTRYISNATVKLTLLFPIKKINKDACISWGEYD